MRTLALCYVRGCPSHHWNPFQRQDAHTLGAYACVYIEGTGVVATCRAHDPGYVDPSIGGERVPVPVPPHTQPPQGAYVLAQRIADAPSYTERQEAAPPSAALLALLAPQVPVRVPVPVPDQRAALAARF